MIETKTKTHGWLLQLLSALFLLSGLTACSSTEDSAEDSSKPKPEVPVNDGDWQIVSASGGTIVKDDISITFPSKTFSEDAKVAISETSAKKLTASDIGSKFYQVVLPKTGTSKEISVSVKFERTVKNPRMIISSIGWNKHLVEQQLTLYELKTSITDNTATATIEECCEYEDTNPFFYIGVIDASDKDNYSKTATRSTIYRFKVNRDVSNEEYEKNKVAYDKIEEYLNENVPIAHKKLNDLGFRLPSVDIQYLVREPKDEKEEEMCGSWTCGYGIKWHGNIYINKKRLLQFVNNPNSTELLYNIQETLIHETVHAIHDIFYDSRSGRNIGADGLEGDESALLDEAMGTWVEKFWGKEIERSHNTVLNLPYVLKSFFPPERSSKTYQKHGYGLAAFIEYLSQKTDDKKIVRLFDLKRRQSLRDAINDFLKEQKISFFDIQSYNDFVTKVFNGQIIYDLRIDSCTTSKQIIISENNLNIDIEHNLYSWGTGLQKIGIRKAAIANNPNKIIKWTQEHEGVTTRIFYLKDKTLKQIGEFSKEKPISISVTNFCKELGIEDPNTIPENITFYLTATRNENKDDLNTIPSKANIKFEIDENHYSVKPTELSFESQGGTKPVKIDKGDYKYCGADITAPDDNWLMKEELEDGTVNITALPNETQIERQGTVYCWVSKKENPSDTDKKYINPPVIVTQEAGDGESLLDQTDLVFPVEGGVRFINYSFGPYLWMKKTWDDDSWLRTTWSIDYLSNIGYNPSNENRYANQLYVCCFPNETGSDREQTITFSYANEKGFDFDKGDKFPVKVKQEGGVFNLDMMKNLFVGTWYTPSDIEYNRSEGHYYHRRYTFRADNTIILEGKTTNSASKPATWDTEFTGTYSVLSYEVKGDRVRVYIKVPKDDTWYKIRIERFPHFIYFAYENSDGSLWHGVYMEPE